MNPLEPLTSTELRNKLYAESTANRLDIDLQESVIEDNGELIRVIEWSYDSKKYVAYSYNEAVDELENIADGGQFRRMEAEADRRHEEYVFGDQCEEP